MLVDPHSWFPASWYSQRRSDAIVGARAVPLDVARLRDSVDVSVIPPTTDVVPATHAGVRSFFERLLSASSRTDIPDAGLVRLADIMTQATAHKNATVQFSIQGGDAELSQFFAHSRRLSEAELEITVYAAQASVSVQLYSVEDHRECKKKRFRRRASCHTYARHVAREGMTAAETVEVMELLQATAQDTLAERHGLMIAAAVEVSAAAQ